MQLGSTVFLKGVVVFIGLAILTVCVVGLPIAIQQELQGDFDYLPLLVGLYIPMIPFFFALYQALKLLSYIDKNIAFSELSITALRNIKYCAVGISVVFAGGMPYIFYLADRDDAPGLAAIGFVIVGASLVIATFAAVLQKLVHIAVIIKSGHDLTF